MEELFEENIDKCNKIIDILQDLVEKIKKIESEKVLIINPEKCRVVEFIYSGMIKLFETYNVDYTIEFFKCEIVKANVEIRVCTDILLVPSDNIELFQKIIGSSDECRINPYEDKAIINFIVTDVFQDIAIYNE